jgi:hypothetical protein
MSLWLSSCDSGAGVSALTTCGPDRWPYYPGLCLHSVAILVHSQTQRAGAGRLPHGPRHHHRTIISPATAPSLRPWGAPPENADMLPDCLYPSTGFMITYRRDNCPPGIECELSVLLRPAAASQRSSPRGSSQMARATALLHDDHFVVSSTAGGVGSRRRSHSSTGWTSPPGTTVSRSDLGPTCGPGSVGRQPRGGFRERPLHFQHGHIALRAAMGRVNQRSRAGYGHIFTCPLACSSQRAAQLATGLLGAGPMLCAKSVVVQLRVCRSAQGDNLHPGA